MEVLIDGCEIEICMSTPTLERNPKFVKTAATSTGRQRQLRNKSRNGGTCENNGVNSCLFMVCLPWLPNFINCPIRCKQTVMLVFKPVPGFCSLLFSTFPLLSFLFLIPGFRDQGS